MRRRDFIQAIAGCAIASPRWACAQQVAGPVIGFLGAETAELFASRLSAFRQGLLETGYVEGRNLTIEYRWAKGHNDRLPALADDLVRRQTRVIVTGGTPAALAAKAATATIAIVASLAVDPLAVGTRCEPCPTWRQCDSGHHVGCRGRAEATRDLERALA